MDGHLWQEMIHIISTCLFLNPDELVYCMLQVYHEINRSKQNIVYTKESSSLYLDSAILSAYK